MTRDMRPPSSGPEIRVARSAFDRRFRKKTLVAVVNGVVRCVRNRDQEFRIENCGISRLDVQDRHRIHVMDDDSFVKLMSLDTEIAAVVSNYDLVTDLTPLR